MPIVSFISPLSSYINIHDVDLDTGPKMVVAVGAREDIGDIQTAEDSRTAAEVAGHHNLGLHHIAEAGADLAVHPIDLVVVAHRNHRTVLAEDRHNRHIGAAEGRRNLLMGPADIRCEAETRMTGSARIRMKACCLCWDEEQAKQTCNRSWDRRLYLPSS